MEGKLSDSNINDSQRPSSADLALTDVVPEFEKETLEIMKQRPEKIIIRPDRVIIKPNQQAIRRMSRRVEQIEIKQQEPNQK